MWKPGIFLAGCRESHNLAGVIFHQSVDMAQIFHLASLLFLNYGKSGSLYYRANVFEISGFRSSHRERGLRSWSEVV